MDFSIRDRAALALLRQLGNLPYNPPSYTCAKEFVGSYLLSNAHSPFVPDPILNQPPAVWTADPPYRKHQ
jgi:hypothetical protein